MLRRITMKFSTMSKDISWEISLRIFQKRSGGFCRIFQVKSELTSKRSWNKLSEGKSKYSNQDAKTVHCYKD